MKFSTHRSADYLPKQKNGIRGLVLSPVRLIAAVAFAVTLAACGSSNKGLSYLVPDNICGISVDPEILESLLHDGDELEQDTGPFSLTEGQICHMYVDGNDSVLGVGDWHESGFELRDHFVGLDRKHLHYSEGGKVASWPSGIITAIRCPGVSEEGDVLTVELSDIRSDENSRELLEKLAPEYFDGYAKRLGCPT
ncbi:MULTISPECIES: hypothetical protein [unclassified Streptomyces]|uniref:hypothetical protein n=1 Tax=unclassified Streptomyces TaxID=2593676 RepID=UPI000F711CA2|nr:MULTISPECIES: hypothetical protein [unclassified Streptomyces]AZM59724.1 hypothetical protein DLM49_09275 [Streptomyces sp. WAC 01438]RSM87675.1 hypothetical protein DMA10_35080 [Streptomyces sp. WAC 01420]